MSVKKCPQCGTPQQWEMRRHCACGYDFGPPEPPARQTNVGQESAHSISNQVGHIFASLDVRLKKFYSIVITVAIVNFAAFMIGVGALGGDAVNGKSGGGRYYVANHGRLTEVSKAAYIYSRFHCYSIWITHSLALIVCFIAHTQRRSSAALREKSHHA